MGEDRDVELNKKVAVALFEALRVSGPEAVLQGDPLRQCKDFNERLTEGVLIDGYFDFTVAATYLISKIEMR